MISSTSSSDRAPAGANPWFSIALTLLLAAAALGTLEQFWRARGHRPTVIDDEALWCQQRQRAVGSRVIALVGTSRILLGTSLDRIRLRLPGYEPVQLAIGGKHPLAVLRDLADDESFQGVAIVSVVAQAFERRFVDDQEDFVRACREPWRLEPRVARLLRTPLEEHLVVMTPRVSLREVGRSVFTSRQLPSPWWVHRNADRSGSIDYALWKPAAPGVRPIRHYYYARSVSPAAVWLAATAPVEGWIRKIVNRGGSVALVRLPTSGDQWKRDEQHYPRARYWDAFAAQSVAPTFHFSDDLRLASFEQPDDSHVGADDIAAFTDALFEGLQARGVFANH